MTFLVSLLWENKDLECQELICFCCRGSKEVINPTLSVHEATEKVAPSLATISVAKDGEEMVAKDGEER